MKTISISKTHLTWLLAAMVLAFGMLTVQPAGQVQGAGPIIVKNGNDHGADSLRQAITDADPGMTINFDNDYEIHLESSLIIDKDLTIDGELNKIVIDGMDAVQVFSVNSGVTFNMNRLTVSGASGGKGGGIYNDGTLNITNSTFSGNNATVGGGVYNHGTGSISNSTFADNQAGEDGGGVYNEAILTVTNSTFSGNRTTGSGGGIRTVGVDAILRNTIVSNSPSGDNCSGIFADGGGNLVWGDHTCPGIHQDPLLSTLDYYNGNTKSFALLPGSAAIEAGDPGICAAAPVSNHDQRGVARPQGAQCDIGAFESRGFTLSVFGGNSQSAAINTAFTNPLQVSISPVSAGEPVNGGTVTFTPPASGASAIITGSPATISGGHAQVTATANGISGSYNVNTSTPGAASTASFSLTNCLPCHHRHQQQRRWIGFPAPGDCRYMPGRDDHLCRRYHHPPCQPTGDQQEYDH
jgi:predicted outer membrane repeat protein